MKNAYIAINEHPRIICAYGKNEAKAFKRMADALDQLKFDEEYILSISGDYTEDGYFNLSVVVSGI